MIAYKLEIVEVAKRDDEDYEGDVFIGTYTTKEIAIYAWKRLLKKENEFIDNANSRCGLEWKKYEQEYIPKITEFIIDDFSWDE